MGMFDDIACFMPLPGAPIPQYPYFQTKDFDCVLDKYSIEIHGRLLKNGSPFDYTGIINFYTFEGGGKPGTMGRWFEYEAQFTDGWLDKLELVLIHDTPFGGPQKILYRRDNG